MNKQSLKKYSVLGLVLVAASAVTAAVIPSKSKSDSKAKRAVGQLVVSTGGAADPNNGNTCINASNGAACDYTATGNGAGLSSTSRTNSDAANDNHSTTNNQGNATGTGTTEF